MLSGIKRFVSRNRKKFIVVSVAVGGTYLALRYAKRKLIEFQESNTKEFFEKTRHIQHFESTERTCNQAIVSLTAEVSEKIWDLLNTDVILEKLRNSTDDRLAIWENLKFVTFTRLTTLIYATTILVITLRVQLNVLGGYLYKDTKSTEPGLSQEIQQSYLSLVQNFLHSGLMEMVKLIESKVKIVLESYPLTKKLNLSEIEQIFWSIQMAVNSDPMEPSGHLARYLFPDRLDDAEEILKKMYNETLDIMESDDVTSLCTNSISRGFSIAVDNIAEYFSDTKKPEDYLTTANGKTALEDRAETACSSIVNINSLELPLAKIIPIISGITARNENCSGRTTLSTSLVAFYVMSEKIKLLGTNVYEVFSV